jgi:hypothetical protein
VLRGGVGLDPEVHDITQGARERFFELITGGLAIKPRNPTIELRVWGWMGFVEATCTRWLETRELSHVSSERRLYWLISVPARTRDSTAK